MAGGFGVGKTTFVGAVSEIAPLEQRGTADHRSARAPTGLEGVEIEVEPRPWRWTSAASPWTEQHVLYLLGTPGQERFWFMWDELCEGALGAVVHRRHAAAGGALRRRGLLRAARSYGFIVAVNEFDGAYRYEPDEVRSALDLGPEVPVVLCDARIAMGCRDAAAGTGAERCFPFTQLDPQGCGGGRVPKLRDDLLTVCANSH
ncbi:hypothetical protein SMICM17S_12728 [Streptomyces microflavus]